MGRGLEDVIYNTVFSGMDVSIKNRKEDAIVLTVHGHSTSCSTTFDRTWVRANPNCLWNEIEELTVQVQQKEIRRSQ